MPESRINNYSYKPCLTFHNLPGEEGEPLYMGCEIEVDNGKNREQGAKSVSEVLGDDHAYCKYDGSLGPEGFEIVTYPCTLGYHKSMPYEKLFKNLASQGYRSHDTSNCGLHIHINRAFFGTSKLEQDLNISKLIYLFEKFWGQVVTIARRGPNRFAQRVFLEDDESPLDLYGKSKSDRRLAINLQNKDTVEIRIFKGTIKYSTFLNTLEFVSVMCHAAKDVSIYDVQTVSWKNIQDSFSESLNKYYMERKAKPPKQDNAGRTFYVTSRGSSGFSSNFLDTFSSLQASIPDPSFTPVFSYDLGTALSSSAQEHSTLSETIGSIEIERLRGDIDSLVKDIKRQKKLVRRASNALTRINLQRELEDLNRQLGDAKRALQRRQRNQEVEE